MVEKGQNSAVLTVILHADVAGSTRLVQLNESLAHDRITETFAQLSRAIEHHGGTVHEVRGDALLAEFPRASDAVSAALEFQQHHHQYLDQIEDELKPQIRIGISLGEVIVADRTVTGPGVVLAQRVEQLAEPGGICITPAIQEALPKRLPVDQESLGDQILKGFDEPVRVYRVMLKPGAAITPPEQSRKEVKPISKKTQFFFLVACIVILVAAAVLWQQPWMSQEQAASPDRMAFPLPDKPSIAVLPFNNMSADENQEYFTDGMTEDLITDLSKLPELFVIARNSVFTYKNKAVRVQQVAEELGVRYVLEGSVRRAGNQVRINAQLIDAITGGHLWAERYDGSLDNVFALQDEVTRQIVRALAANIGGELTTELEDETSNSQAYDLFLQGWEHYQRGTPDAYAKAIPYFEQAIELDPNYNRAHAALAAVYWNSLWKGWYRQSLGSDYYFQAHEQVRVLLRQSQQRPTALTHQVASEYEAYFSRSPKKALSEAERALSLDPNNPAAHLAMANALLKDNRSREAEQSIRKAMRLNPHHPSDYLVRLAQAQYLLGDFESAAQNLERAVDQNPDDDWALVYLVASYGQLNRSEESKPLLAKANALRAKAGWGLVTVVAASHPRFRWLGKRKALVDGLRKAGAPTGGEWFGLINREGERFEVKGAITVDAKAAKVLHEEGAIFIDTWAEWFIRRIPGAYFAQLGNFSGFGEGWLFNEAALLRIADFDEKIVFYDPSPHPPHFSATAAAIAVSRGFKKVYYFPGGLSEWEAAGYPVEIND